MTYDVQKRDNGKAALRRPSRLGTGTLVTVAEMMERDAREIALLADMLKQAEAENKLLRNALQNLTRWVGKGIADGAYRGCVLPQAAEADLACAEAALEATDA